MRLFRIKYLFIDTEALVSYQVPFIWWTGRCRKKEELDLGYMERQEDGYLEHDDQDDHDDETGVIDRTKGRRIKKGCSTVMILPLGHSYTLTD